MLAVPLRALGTSSRLTRACRWKFVQKSSTNSCAKQCATNEKRTSRTDALPIERFQLDFRILAIWTVCKALWLPAWRAAKHFMQATQGASLPSQRHLENLSICESSKAQRWALEVAPTKTSAVRHEKTLLLRLLPNSTTQKRTPTAKSRITPPSNTSSNK
jgi:hypothetical protein